MAKSRYLRSHGRRVSTHNLVLTMILMLLMVLLVLVSIGILSFPITVNSHEDDSHFLNEIILTSRKLGHIDDGFSRTEQWTDVLSWEPRVFLHHSFLSRKECEHLITLAKPHMTKSTVVDSTTGESKDSRVRTSSGMFLERGADKIITEIEERIAGFTFIPVENGEGLQVLRYDVGQKYEPHYDYFLDEFNIKNGGQRIATVLMYLSDVEEGGETVFPDANANFSSVPWWNELSECGKNGLSVKPKMGDALLFWSMRPNAIVDPLSLHGGCPVIKGSKWSSTKWLHVKEYV